MSDSTYREITLRDGRALAYAEYGSPSGQPIIYCHGTPSSRVEGGLIVDNQTATDLGLRFIVPDRPGMGFSDYVAGRKIVDWPNDVSTVSVLDGDSARGGQVW
jgi:pimeloyl-ACP methyl ester carboxylesterase